MRENILHFGAKASLVGIMTGPPAKGDTDHYPGVILLNAGILHRVGPNRLHVKIARQLAAAGFVVLRFDFSGMGDSEMRGTNLSFEQSVISETQEAMDVLTATQGVQRFILMGICWGADHAFRVACSDARVVGAALINNDSVLTTGYHLRAYRRRLLSPRSWWSFVTGKSDLWGFLKQRIRWPLSGPSHQLNHQNHQDLRMLPKEQVVADLRALVARGVDVCLIYAAGDPAYYHYRARLKDAVHALRSSGKLRVDVFQATDHAFTPLTDQELLVDVLHNWTQRIVKAQEVIKV